MTAIKSSGGSQGGGRRECGQAVEGRMGWVGRYSLHLFPACEWIFYSNETATNPQPGESLFLSQSDNNSNSSGNIIKQLFFVLQHSNVLIAAHATSLYLSAAAAEHRAINVNYYIALWVAMGNPFFNKSIASCSFVFTFSPVFCGCKFIDSQNCTSFGGKCLIHFGADDFTVMQPLNFVKVPSLSSSSPKPSKIEHSGSYFFCLCTDLAYDTLINYRIKKM